MAQGIDAAKLRTIVKIKSERGARVGRYIIASTTAKYQVPATLRTVRGKAELKNMLRLVLTPRRLLQCS